MGKNVGKDISAGVVCLFLFLHSEQELLAKTI